MKRSGGAGAGKGKSKKARTVQTTESVPPPPSSGMMTRLRHRTIELQKKESFRKWFAEYVDGYLRTQHVAVLSSDIGHVGAHIVALPSATAENMNEFNANEVHLEITGPFFPSSAYAGIWPVEGIVSVSGAFSIEKECLYGSTIDPFWYVGLHNLTIDWHRTKRAALKRIEHEQARRCLTDIGVFHGVLIPFILAYLIGCWFTDDIPDQ